MSVVESNPMLLLADSYAAELSAQFRTLNLFVSHAGEIGRTHEAYLRNVIRRFPPEKYGIGTGFVASGRWISKQQDIIVYNQHDLPLMFKAGDCVVADLDATVGTLEVKTRLNNREDFSEAYTKLCDLYKQIGGLRFVGLYAWEGLNVDTALDTIWHTSDPTSPPI
jgi:hypothetical protein